MLRRTQRNDVFIHIFGPTKMNTWRPTNQNINKVIAFLRERSKMHQYYGSRLLRLPDRDMIWPTLGGPRAQMYLRKSKSGRQANHYTANENTWELKSHSKFGHGNWQSLTGFTVQAWTGQMQASSPTSFWATNAMGSREGLTNHGQMGNGASKDTQIAFLEKWGMKTTVIDERTAPRVGDMLAHKHKLYQHNFPWIKDPVTDRLKGDADWQWRGADDFDYSAAPISTSIPSASTKKSEQFDHSGWARIEGAVSQNRGGAAAVAAPEKKSSGAKKAKA